MSGIRRSVGTDMLVPILMLAGAAAAAVAPFILFVELYEWLTSSEWPGLTLADGLSLFGVHHEFPETDAQRLDDVFLATPLTIALFATGASLFVVGAALGSWERERELYEELRDKTVFTWLTLWGASDVSFPTAFRLLFLEACLQALLLLGAALIVSEVVLVSLGAELRWLGLCGLMIVGAGFVARAVVRRKFPAGFAHM